MARDPDLLRSLAAQGGEPQSALLVAVEEAFFLCGKALMRSHLWDPDRYVDRAAMPSLGRMISEQIGAPNVAAADAAVAESYTNRLY